MRHQRYTKGGFGPGLVNRIIRPAQPALVAAGIRHPGRLAVADYPPSQAAFHRLTQLLGGMVMDLASVNDGRFNGFAVIIQDHNAGAFTAHVFE